MAGAAYKIYAIKYAEVLRTQSEQYHRFQVYGEPDSPLRTDFFTWVAVGENDTVVVDTGCTEESALARGHTYTGSPRSGLELIGVDPASVTKVVLTHFHYDHIGGTADFPNARFYFSEQEMAFWTGPNLGRLQFRSLANLPDLQDVVRLVYEDRAVFVEDGQQIADGVTAHLMPGHTPGQLTVEAGTDGDSIFLASDTAHYYDEVTKNRPFAIFSDLPALYGSYERLHAMAGYDVRRIVPGHDPAVLENYDWASHAAKGRVVQIA